MPRFNRSLRSIHHARNNRCHRKSAVTSAKLKFRHERTNRHSRSNRQNRTSRNSPFRASVGDSTQVIDEMKWSDRWYRFSGF